MSTNIYLLYNLFIINFELESYTVRCQSNASTDKQQKYSMPAKFNFGGTMIFLHSIHFYIYYSTFYFFYFYK